MVMVLTRTGLDEVPNNKRKLLRPGKLSPHRPVPNHIKRPPYVKNKMAPGIASGSEVHDLKGIECMRASGRLAAQVLNYAGTLVKVILYSFRVAFLCSYDLSVFLLTVNCIVIKMHHGTMRPCNLLFSSVVNLLNRRLEGCSCA